MEVKEIKVEQDGKEMTVFIPETGDKSYDNYLAEAYTEKTQDQLAKKEKPQPKAKREDVIGALKELKEHRDWKKKSGMNRRYY